GGQPGGGGNRRCEEARNPSDLDTLVAVADEIGLDVDRFVLDLKSGAIEKAMQEGFQLRRELQANEFPSLVFRKGERVDFLVRGYDAVEVVLDRLEMALM
ncbi:MAG: DsbA family protein, partial [Candidatus Latescibacterota bacterium]